MWNNLSQTSQKQKTHIYKETKALNSISDIIWRGSHPLQQNESRLKMAKTHSEHEHWLGPSAPLQHGAGAWHRPDGSRHGLAGRQRAGKAQPHSLLSGTASQTFWDRTTANFQPGPPKLLVPGWTSPNQWESQPTRRHTAHKLAVGEEKDMQETM